ncbi:RraA family protein [Methylobacterium sp. A54F]
MPIDRTLADALSAVSSGCLARVLARRSLSACVITGLRAGGSRGAVGPAYTLRLIPARDGAGSSLAAAVDAVPEGAVLVVATHGVAEPLPFAGILAAALAQRGVAGLVTEATLPEEIGLPAWSGAVRGRVGPGLMLAGTAEPIACAGAAVLLGDIVVGDAEGVVVVPAAIAESVALEAVEQQRLDLWLLREAEKGVGLTTLLPPDAAALARFEAETRPA